MIKPFQSEKIEQLTRHGTCYPTNMQCLT